MALREQDVLNMLRLVAEVAAHPVSGTERCHRMLRGLTALVPAPMALAATMSLAPSDGVLHVLSAVACADGNAEPVEFEARGAAGAREWILRSISPVLTRLQAALVAAWRMQGNAFTVAMRRQMGYGSYICSIKRRGLEETLHVVALCRQEGTAVFTERDDQIVQLMHEQVESLTAAVASPRQVVAAGNLPPYLQRIVPELLAGAGEKQIAARLGFTFNTTHQYIKAIYRRMGVSSRAEFMARALQAGGAPVAGTVAGKIAVGGDVGGGPLGGVDTAAQNHLLVEPQSR